VVRLASILRVADALDREHIQAVTGVRVQLQKDRCTLVLEGTGDLLLERWALRRKVNLFEDAFGLKVEVAGGERIAD
jgi:exopolyphosphatase/guanosine-5'-triphosphate,3'-diphosphate pyrophosphatase